MTKNYIPDVYRRFVCSADRCEDTCCKDWDIVIDDDTQALYDSVRGELGERLRAAVTVDGDGDRVFVLDKNGLCPLLGSTGLCTIQQGLGEQALCSTCREFPRITQDYTEFAEYMLSFACPEAVRLMLADSGWQSCYTVESVTGNNNGYPNEIMNFLISARRVTAEIFKQTKLDYEQRLARCLAFTGYVQQLLYTECYDTSKLAEFEYSLPQGGCADRGFVFDLHSSLDIMDESFREDIIRARYVTPHIGEELERELTSLSLYYIYRYYLTAIADDDVTSAVRRIYCAYAVISSLVELYGANNSADKRILITEKYSREIEHSYENSELLKEAFLTDTEFSTENLINTINFHKIAQ